MIIAKNGPQSAPYLFKATHFLHEALHDCDLGGNLGAAHNGHEGALGGLDGTYTAGKAWLCKCSYFQYVYSCVPCMTEHNSSPCRCLVIFGGWMRLG